MRSRYTQSIVNHIFVCVDSYETHDVDQVCVKVRSYTSTAGPPLSTDIVQTLSKEGMEWNRMLGRSGAWVNICRVNIDGCCVTMEWETGGVKASIMYTFFTYSIDQERFRQHGNTRYRHNVREIASVNEPKQGLPPFPRSIILVTGTSAPHYSHTKKESSRVLHYSTHSCAQESKSHKRRSSLTKHTMSADAKI